MSETDRRTAVGAGTTAGDAGDEEHAIESRAAEAEVDGMLESLRVTGARPTGGPENPAALRPERPRADLKHNQAGIAARREQG